MCESEDEEHVLHSQGSVIAVNKNEKVEMTVLQSAANILTRDLLKFRGIHDGETCYIFGDGPSIKWFDLKEFNDHPAICCNMFPFHKDFDDLNVKYVICVEPWIFVPRFIQPRGYHGFRNVAAEYKKHLYSMHDKEIFVSLSNRFSLRGKNIHYVYRRLPRYINHTDKLLSQFDCFSGSFYATLALAYFLGFKTIILIGFDAWTIQPARKSHWYEYGEGELFEATNFAHEFLNVLRSVVDIVTIVGNGQSRNVKAISYETYTGKPLVFKENHELLTDRDFKIMSTNPRYMMSPSVT